MKSVRNKLHTKFRRMSEDQKNKTCFTSHEESFFKCQIRQQPFFEIKDTDFTRLSHVKIRYAKPTIT